MTIFQKLGRFAVPLAFAAVLGLAACSKDPTPDEPETNIENETMDEPAPEKAPPAPEVLNETPSANVADAAPVDHTSEDQQMQEDADASGMTSRLPPPNQTVAAGEGGTPQ